MTGRFKDRYGVKLLKWHLYKRFTKAGRWHTQFAFERAVRALQPGDVAIDCGANLGVYSIIMARTGATVHAFEPDPQTFERLRANVREYPNVICHQCAVGDRSGDVEFYRAADYNSDPEHFSLSSSVFADKVNISTAHAISVPQIDLIAFVEGTTANVKLTKIDVEGAEVPLIEAMIERGKLSLFGEIFVETHETKIPGLAERTARLRAFSETPDGQMLHLDWD